MKIDENEIRKTFSIINPELTEVRLIGPGFTASGYFKDANALIFNLKKYLYKTNVNCYMIFNKIDNACYARSQMSQFIERAKETTGDRDITERKWMMLDFDCERPAGVSSTEEELKIARGKAGEVYRYLHSIGFEKPVIALSGNGVHLMYRIALANDSVCLDLIKNCLIALDMMFSDEHVKIDTTVSNASRLTKLYGTQAQKGQSTTDRPHRMSMIVDVPEEIKITPADILVALASKIPEPPARPAYSGQASIQFDLNDWIRKHGILISRIVPYQTGKKHILEECPFNHDHKDAAIFELANGAIGFSCFHNTCSQYGWKEFRLHFEPDAYTQRTTPRVNSQQPKETVLDKYKDEPDWITAETSKNIDRSQIISIKTGIHLLDRKIAGLNKGEVSVMSGLNGSGKTSILSQIALETVNQGYKVALYSGEMKDHRVFNWLRLQAAGRLFTKETDIEGFYIVEQESRTLIDKWLNSDMYLYNNNKGHDITHILEATEQVIKEKKVDLIILDNLMAMDLSLISGDKYEKQSDFIKRLMKFAPQNDVHIILVAHPRKAMGFLRKDDISGTADLTNAVDNVFIVHRVNNDFKRLSGQMFGWHEGYELYDYDNVIEVCKNRDFGVQDLFVGVMYEQESKRFLNEPHEVRHLKWEDGIQQPVYHWEESDATLPFDL